ncbi:MAG: hypothetical protein RBS80_18415 [Thermoguttaceae bacterium]|jgi:hypothetical protein|nr:hypothetical protein [Thermoguttaceae bacterium]
MSQVTMTIIDPHRAIHGRPHGSYIDEVVAALSADPETIEELEAAMARFAEIGEYGPFAGWQPGIDDEPYDSGVCIVDLGARLVVAESTYVTPIPAGEVQYRCGDARHDDDPWVPFHLADDWKLRFDAVDWAAEADARREKRLAAGPLDFRKVLYGEVCRFIVEQCFAAKGDGVAAGDWTPPPDWTFTDLPERVNDDGVPVAEHAVAEIHARWLMTPRDDLRGQSPRDVLLAGKSHIDWDLQDRGLQWSRFRACPPALSRESAAFRFGPCGMHENVLYYEMVRDLVWNCWRRVVEPKGEGAEQAAPDAAGEGPAPADEIARLEQVQKEWLATPDFDDLGMRPPGEVIEFERMRIPMTASGNEAVIDPDCPLCQMMAEGSEFGPMFWHLDGCNMDQDFPFSFHPSREAWEEEQREWEAHRQQFEEEWEREQAEKAARAEAGAEEDFAGDSIWTRTFSGDGAGDQPLSARVFGIGAHVAELGVDLKESPDTRPYMESLNRHFGNLRAAMDSAESALIEPVIERFREELHAVSDVRADLGDKCTDLDRQLREFAARVSDEDEGEPFDWEDDIPF